MYILIAMVIAASAGLAAHYLLPARELRGVALSPVIATVTAGVVYTALQWAGVGENSVWLWVASLAGGIAAGLIATIALTRSRARRDEERAQELGLTPR